MPKGRESWLAMIGDLPVGTPVAFEATFGWGWLIELLQDHGFEPRMAHASQCEAIASARLKNAGHGDRCSRSGAGRNGRLVGLR